MYVSPLSNSAIPWSTLPILVPLLQVREVEFPLVMDLVPPLNTGRSGRCCIRSSPPLCAITNRRILSQDIWWFSFPANALRKWKLGFGRFTKQDDLCLLASSNLKKRKTKIFAVGQEAEKSFQSTVELDRLIDKLRVTNEQQLPKIVVENIFAFDSMFWTRLAARAELCESEDDKKDYEDLASSLMSIVERCVQKTTEKIESATDVLKAIIKPITNEDEEIVWPPRDPQNVILMKKQLAQREQEGQLDEGFLSEVNAQLRQAKEDGDKPGLVAILQKVLQLYSSKVLSKRSYAYKDGEVIKAEEFLEAIIKANEEDWNGLLLNGLTVGTGRITPEEFNHAIDKRVERTLLRTESGSYQQRVLMEYLREIKSRTQCLVEAFQNQQPS